MFIKRVVLRNIRGFRDADLELGDEDAYAGWAAITGDNGSGKTALLRAIALAVAGPEAVHGLVPDLSGWVTAGEPQGSISVEIRPHHEYDRTVRGGYPAQTFWAELEIRKLNGEWDVFSADILRHKKKGAANGPWPASTPGWFALGYGPFRRLYGSSPDAQRLMMLPGRIPRFATLFREDATLAEGEEWVKTLRYKSYESRPKEQLALEELLRLLGDDFLRHGVQVKEVNSEGIWLIDAAGRRMVLAEMSEGYRAALAMMIDIFRHMVDIYGAEIVIDTEGRVVVNRPGVVMIDEVDAHLHPDWQRYIGPWLVEHFPLVQFIVTTHSPLICQSSDHGRIYHLPQPGKGVPFQLQPSDYDRVIAGRPDEILLTPAFGLKHTRSQRAVRSRERHALLISKRFSVKGLTKDEESELEQLSLFVDSHA